MAIITDIKRQFNNKNRYSLFLDNEFVCGLDAITVAKFRLEVGKEVDPEEFSAAIHETELNAAFEYSLRFITVRMRSKKEMIDKLNQREYSKRVVQEVVSKLEEYGYVDDYAFCDNYVSVHYKDYSRMMLLYNLKQRCTNADAIESACDKVTEEMETESACRTACRFLTRNRGPKYKLIYKLKKALYQRGYSQEYISMAVEYAKNKYKEQLKESDEE